MPDPREVYNRTFRAVGHAGDDQVCINMRRRDSDQEPRPWRQVYCFKTSEALSLAQQLLDAVKENIRRQT